MMRNNKLRRLRLLNDLTQNQLSIYLQISQSLYSLVENGKRKPSAELRSKLKKFYHLVNEEDLF